MDPEISVVIPSYRRTARLAFTLEALAGQTLASDRFEVIVVRHSDEEAPPVPDGLPVRFLTQPAPGPAMRRNRGWREARGALVAFTDDDCRPAPDWLERLLAAGADGAVLQGRTEPDPDERHLEYGIARTIRVLGADRWYQACNIAYSRNLLERLGGFDEELAFFGEDTDLGLRAEDEGARLVYVDEAVVWHAVHVRSLREALRDAVERNAEAAVVARHPRLRDELYLGVFTSEEHAKVVLAVAGAALWRRSRVLGGLLAYPYVMGRIGKRLRNPNPLSAIGAFRLAADVLIEGGLDAVEVAARLRSSIEHGEVVL